MKIELAKTEIIHFVGIGGIGMSGLSLIMKGMGFNVQGSDITNNKNIDRLKKDKIKVSTKHNKKDYLYKKNNLKKLNYQNTWNNANQKILKAINEN